MDNAGAADDGVTFEIKCYENDWEYILGGGAYLRKLISRCGVNFTRKQLIINNIRNREVVTSYAEKRKAEGVIDDYFFAEDMEEEVLAFFGISKESFGTGFVYSISELTGIYTCRTPYLLHFSSDSFPCGNVKKSNWIQDFIAENKKNPDYIVSTLVWNHKVKEAKAESYGTVGKFLLAQGFSDQCYLINVAAFSGSIYNEHNEASGRYPAYGGELFEKRVDAYMRNHGKYRLIYKGFSYRHANFPRKGIKRFISLRLARSGPFTFCLFGREPNTFDLFIRPLKQDIKRCLRSRLAKVLHIL